MFSHNLPYELNSLFTTSFFVDFIIVMGDSLSIRISDRTEQNIAKFTVFPSHHIFLPCNISWFSLKSRTYVIACSYGLTSTPRFFRYRNTGSGTLQASMNSVAESAEWNDGICIVSLYWISYGYYLNIYCEWDSIIWCAMECDVCCDGPRAAESHVHCIALNCIVLNCR
jgi:hypothetical protein